MGYKPKSDSYLMSLTKAQIIEEVKIDAMLSGDSNTAYKMVGAETVCIAILQDLEAIKG